LLLSDRPFLPLRIPLIHETGLPLQRQCRHLCSYRGGQDGVLPSVCSPSRPCDIRLTSCLPSQVIFELALLKLYAAQHVGRNKPRSTTGFVKAVYLAPLKALCQVSHLRPKLLPRSVQQLPRLCILCLHSHLIY
jgi:hypothetical protein